jgi:hypothetical protein
MRTDRVRGRDGLSRGRAFLRGLAAAALACVFTLLVIEGVLRTTHAFGAHVSWSEPDPLLGFRSTPGSTFWLAKENDHAISERFNSHGMRDRERSLERAEGVCRVAFLGDSFVEALQVEIDSTFLFLAEGSLKSEGSPAELLNFGRSGATQSEELLILQRDALRFSPDIVALLVVPQNDVADVRPGTADGLLRPFFTVGEDGALQLDTRFSRTEEFAMRARINGLKQRSALVSLLADRYNMLQLARRSASLAPEDGVETLPGYLTLCTEHPDPAYVSGYAMCKTLIKAMVDTCQSRGIGFLLVCCDVSHRPDETSRWRALDATFDPWFFERDLGAFADSLGIAFLGLQDAFSEAARDGGPDPHWGHWSYRGHRVAAPLVADAVRVLCEDRLSGGSTSGEGLAARRERLASAAKHE